MRNRVLWCALSKILANLCTVTPIWKCVSRSNPYEDYNEVHHHLQWPNGFLLLPLFLFLKIFATKATWFRPRSFFRPIFVTVLVCSSAAVLYAGLLAHTSPSPSCRPSSLYALVVTHALFFSPTLGSCHLFNHPTANNNPRFQSIQTCYTFMQTLVRIYERTYRKTNTRGQSSELRIID